MIKFPVNLQYGSSTHCTLRYVSMKKRAVSTDDLLSMFPNKFSERYYARRAMDMLSKYGYVKALDDKVQITPLGDAYLSKIAKHYVGEFK